MATPDDEEQRMQVDGDGNDSLLSDLSDSENDLSGDEEPTSNSKIEWLATGREKRSTAGNRMKSMIAAEEPDDELELLFAEDANDAGFSDVEDDASDGQMSSSEDEDAQENADELEGEKELEKQARESRQAARKRKAQEAIPLKFRKKVKIDTSQTPSASASATPTPKPRPRKKSERLSWLPSPADMPTRASRRETTMAGKEQLHKQMAEREVKRLQQIEAMERKAKKMEALKKPPMTQAERLAEAALVEKRNAKSLNRWEEAEKQREEERKAKLAALNNRTLEGPVVTFWSGVGEWIDGKLKHVGKIVTIEEKPAKKKRHSIIGPQSTQESTAEARENRAGQADVHPAPDKAAPSILEPTTPKATNVKSEQGKVLVSSSTTGLVGTGDENAVPSTGSGQESHSLHGSSVVETTSTVSPVYPVAPTTQGGEEVSTTPNSRNQDLITPENASQPRVPPSADIRPPDLKPPDLQPPSTGLYTTSMFAPPSQPSLMMPPELKPPSNSFLAPPVGVSQSGLSMPVIGYHSSLSSPNSSHVFAPPNSARRQSPLSMPQTNIHPPPLAPIPNQPTPAISTPKPSAPPASLITPTPKSTPISTPTPTRTPTISHNRPPSKTPLNTLKSTKGNSQKQNLKEVAPPPPPSPPANGKATRNCIILQNFNENAVKDKSIQTRILFNREMNKLPKQGPAVRCVITNHPARYRDPRTGLPYYNAYAFKEIRKLYSGEYKWSSLVGAWSGNGTSAATGVPARFLDPDAPGPAKEEDPPSLPTDDDETTEGSNKDTEHQKANAEPVHVPALSAPQSGLVTAPVIGGPVSSNTPATTAGPSMGPGHVETAPIKKEPSSGTQPYIPTTGATFELNTNYIPAVAPPPMARTANSKSVDDVAITRPTNMVNTPSDLSGPPAVTVAVPHTSSSVPSTVVEQGAVNQ
ncbi:YL1 nuclear protein-domain-containing protein [Xylaria cf. heliscus]|nr:YL1 nuclear protein-domain-containing protein [Xylaria cf. heliscus]